MKVPSTFSIEAPMPNLVKIRLVVPEMKDMDGRKYAVNGSAYTSISFIQHGKKKRATFLHPPPHLNTHGSVETALYVIQFQQSPLCELMSACVEREPAALCNMQMLSIKMLVEYS